jgi:hypothetical protein
MAAVGQEIVFVFISLYRNELQLFVYVCCAAFNVAAVENRTFASPSWRKLQTQHIR